MRVRAGAAGAVACWLACAGLADAQTTTYPTPLEREPLLPALVSGGFDPDQRLFVSWLGVTPYLESATVIETLETLASLPAGVEVVFDYGPAAGSLTGLLRAAYAMRAARVAAVGEPWLSGFEPRNLIDAVARTPDVVLHIAGDGELRAELQGEELCARLVRAHARVVIAMLENPQPHTAVLISWPKKQPRRSKAHCCVASRARPISSAMKTSRSANTSSCSLMR